MWIWSVGLFLCPPHYVLAAADSRVRISCVCAKLRSFAGVALVLPSLKVKHFGLFIILRFLIEQKPHPGLCN